MKTATLITSDIHKVGHREINHTIASCQKVQMLHFDEQLILLNIGLSLTRLITPNTFLIEAPSYSNIRLHFFALSADND